VLRSVRFTTLAWCKTKYQIINKLQAKIFEFSPHPLPLPSGERGRVRGIGIWKFFGIWDLEFGV
jgi:hypothetical protein